MSLTRSTQRIDSRFLEPACVSGNFIVNPEAMAAVERIEGWRALGSNVIETIINKSEKVKDLKNKAKTKELTSKEKA